MRITAALAAIATIVAVGLLAGERAMAQTNLQTNVQTPGPTSTDALVV